MVVVAIKVMVACHMVVSITHMVVNMVVSISLMVVACLMVVVPVMVVACLMVVVSLMSISLMVVVSVMSISLMVVASVNQVVELAAEVVLVVFGETLKVTRPLGVATPVAVVQATSMATSVVVEQVVTMVTADVAVAEEPVALLCVSAVVKMATLQLGAQMLPPKLQTWMKMTRLSWQIRWWWRV